MGNSPNLDSHLSMSLTGLLTFMQIVDQMRFIKLAYDHISVRTIILVLYIM